ncbi:MAG: hypothetical protein R3C20_08405 [Planctomycetaceae bacterium]
MSRLLSIVLLLQFWILFCPPLTVAQESDAPEELNSPETSEPDPGDKSPAAAESALAEKWDRLIYVPFRELQKVFDNQDASVVIPYREYMDLIQKYLDAQDRKNGWSPDAVVTSSTYTAVVDRDVVRIRAELQLKVMKDGWVRVPLAFGSAATGKVLPADGSVLLKGTGEGQYELLVRGAGDKKVEIELLASVRTSPESKSFSLKCLPTGISELLFTVPEADQSVTITPLQVLLPFDSSSEKNAGEETTVKASLGSVAQFEVQWNPRAGTKPVMDLLASASTVSTVRIETGLIQTTSKIDYEVLRGELRDVGVLAPLDARIIDVVSSSGRIRSWNVTSVGETHQLISMELISPITDRFQVEVQSERTPTSDTIQIVGKADDGKLQGIHADAVVRESGRILVSTDSSLTTVVKLQSGMKRVDAGAAGKSGSSVGSELQQAWEFSGTTGKLVLQLKPVEPRILVDQTSRLIFDDDELRLSSKLDYTVERAGVFQLQLKFPDSLNIDTVRADGMSEFNVDKAAGQLTLSLTQKRMGAITVEITGHQSFNATEENVESELPTITPVDTERETGRILVYAPQFVDVTTVEEKLVGVFPFKSEDAETVGRAVRVSSWNYTRRPVAVFVRTTPRPAQLSATVATTVRVEPEMTRQNSIITFNIQNAGIDTFKVAVPELVAGDVRFRTVSREHVIQQRNRAEQSVDGWVTWTLVLQNETTGDVRIGVDWDNRSADGEENGDTTPVQNENSPASFRTIPVEPPRVLPPFAADQNERRRVTLTQVRGEIRLLRHESLSIEADSQGDAVEAIDVRELELMDADGYLAYRYFSQPASVAIRVRKHEIHEVVETVVQRSLIEVVTEKQAMASYRCRYRIVTSERQRLRIDLREDCDLQAPTINGQRTTVERATDVQSAEGNEAYYVNISRDDNSGEPFLLTIQFRCPLDGVPYQKRGSVLPLMLPVIGQDDGSTVIQQSILAVWAPKDISFIGDPDRWNQFGRSKVSWFRPFDSPTSESSTSGLNEWLDDQFNGSAEFARQGNVSLYQSVGRQSEVVLTWWNRPFLFLVISGTVILAALILRRTPWENRITMLLLASFLVSVWWLKDGYAALQFLTAAWPGVCIGGAIWFVNLLLGSGGDARTGHSSQTGDDGGGGHSQAVVSPSATSVPDTPASGTQESAVAPKLDATFTATPVVSPAPEVVDAMNKLMGGSK